MIKILYDLDISKVNNCRYFDNTGHISSLTKEITSKLLKTHDSIFAHQYLGGGYDSVCFVNSNDHKFYIVEPANGLIIAYDLIEGLIQFGTKRLSTIRRKLEAFRNQLKSRIVLNSPPSIVWS